MLSPHRLDVLEEAGVPRARAAPFALRARGTTAGTKGVPSFGYVADIVDGSPLVGTVPEMLALHIAKARPHLRSAPLPFSLPLARLDLLWSRVADDDKAVSFAGGLLEQVVRSLEAEGRGRRRKGKRAGR